MQLKIRFEFRFEIRSEIRFEIRVEIRSEIRCQVRGSKSGPTFCPQSVHTSVDVSVHKPCLWFPGLPRARSAAAVGGRNGISIFGGRQCELKKGIRLQKRNENS